MTVAEAIRRAAGRLTEAGVPDPAWDAEVLLRHVLGWDRARIVSEGPALLPLEAEGRFLALVAERARRRPLQHLVGIQRFWRHEFKVTPDVLVPRPETEAIVETALGLLRDLREPVLVDVGTGSGCIALSLASERADAVVHAVDVSARALDVARENARRLGLEDRVRFHLGNLLDPVVDLEGRIDLVASNPPYVDPADSLAPEVRDHDPAVALFPPGDRFSIYRRLAPQAQRLLRPGRWLVVEIGQGMDAETVTICEGAGLKVVKVLADLRSIPRTVVAQRPEPGRGSTGRGRPSRDPGRLARGSPYSSGPSTRVASTGVLDRSVLKASRAVARSRPVG